MKNHEKNKMKKTYNIRIDARSSNNLEATRRLYRNISEIVKKLEEQKASALTVLDIFTPTGDALRFKLTDYCERLILEDPINHVQKTEELLWRKAFYDIVSTAKKLRKDNQWNEMEKAFLSTHLLVGVGFYHHLILRLQLEYDLNFTDILDFAYPQSHKGLSYVEKNVNSVKMQNADVKKCVTRFIHRSLVCLGDLARYKLDLDPDWDPLIAIRYYKMAIAIDGKSGMPYNQLGTVATNKNYGLDAVYYYMRSVLCLEPFEGSEGNLKRTIIKNSYNGKEKCLTQSCIARLLLLLQLWDNDSMNIDGINQESQSFINEFENCLNVEKSETVDYNSAKNEDTIDKYLSYFKNDETQYFTEDMIFKIIVICLMKISQIQMKESGDVHNVTAFILAVFSQILQFVVIRLQESLLDITEATINFESNKMTNTEKMMINKSVALIKKKKNDNHKDLSDHSYEKAKPEINGNHVNRKMKKLRGKSKNLLTKLRRPRNRKNSSDSDDSDREEALELLSSSEDVSDISETEGVMSDENALSDDGLSDEVTDDEKALAKELNIGNKDETFLKANGTVNIEEKYIEENENDLDTSDINIDNKEKDSLKTTDLVTETATQYNDNSTSAKTLTDVAQMEKQNLDPMKVLKVLNDENMLASIKVCCDWLQGHQEIIRTCAKGSKILLKRLITLLNLINLDAETLFKRWDKNLEVFSCYEKIKEIIEIVPLPEDKDLKGLKLFEVAHKNIDWKFLKKKRLSNIEETLSRVLKLVQFGHYLCSVQGSEVIYENNLFNVLNQDNIVQDSQVENKNVDLDPSKGKLMRHMGKLWLKAEVRALESRLHYKLMSPYLVPDHEAFSKFMPVIKHLVFAKKFIVVIPSIVISALDEMKKISSQAREATRWIENQLQRGSRFLRAQRPHERLPIPFIKGPKPKDKEAWLYFKIIECCHYLTQQNKAGDAEIPVVTLLTGMDDKKMLTFNPEVLAKSAGVNFEHIGAFHAKWKSSVKSHG